VIEPGFGVQRMGTDDLELVLAGLERESAAMADRLVRNRRVWERQLTMLRRELSGRRRDELRLRCMEPPAPDNAAHVVTTILTATALRAGAGSAAARRELAERELAHWFGDVPPIGRIVLGADGVVVTAEADEAIGVRLPAGDGVTGFGDLLAAIADSLGRSLWVLEEFVAPDRVVHTIGLGGPVRDKDMVLLKLVSFPADGGVEVYVAVDRSTAARGTVVPVSIQPA
jgi:hypothetical protein